MIELDTTKNIMSNLQTPQQKSLFLSRVCQTPFTTTVDSNTKSLTDPIDAFTALGIGSNDDGDSDSGASKGDTKTNLLKKQLKDRLQTLLSANEDKDTLLILLENLKKTIQNPAIKEKIQTRSAAAAAAESKHRNLVADLDLKLRF
jgi:hypothetical protein